jgi:hypothetical protein
MLLVPALRNRHSPPPYVCASYRCSANSDVSSARTLVLTHISRNHHRWLTECGRQVDHDWVESMVTIVKSQIEGLREKSACLSVTVERVSFEFDES